MCLRHELIYISYMQIEFYSQHVYPFGETCGTILSIDINQNYTCISWKWNMAREGFIKRLPVKESSQTMICMTGFIVSRNSRICI